ncbi:hypothetical protein F5Y06DRAFT_275924 [Hypoxylon sp. FL0890]|nr:hypothetical protein F5Y06DRAFT_275924 [Hypoxylon sp. FL0890]
MSIRGSSQSNSQSVARLESKTDTTKKPFLNPKETTTPMYTENIDTISQCCVSHWHTHVVKTAPESNDGSSDSLHMSPAPLRIPSDKASTPLVSESQNPPLNFSSEYTFPLPPATMAKPRSRFPPPYSSLVPSKSTPSMEETVSANITTSVGKKSVRRTQSATDIHKVTQCKPLPAQPSVDVNKKEQEETKRWKQKIFRLTPATTGHPNKGANSLGNTGPKADANGVKGASPLTANTPKEQLQATSVTKGDAQLHKGAEQQGKDKGVSGVNRPNDTNENWSEGNTSKEGSEAEAGSRGEKQRLTAEQILWLHRNYRGEATFLKAWGLHINRDADRERGREIMRELMAAEAPKEKERVEHDRQQKRHDQQARLQFTAPSSHSPRDKEGLHAIEE